YFICYQFRSFYFFFFFQAEDGIRDRNVTGVQTCALPISGANPKLTAAPTGGSVVLSWWGSAYATAYKVQRATTPGGPYTIIANRSEERRVGKECRYWCARYHEKKNIVIIRLTTSRNGLDR